MSTNVIPMRKPAANPIACTSCGAQTEAACGCGAGYLPAAKRAAEAIAQKPGLSDRAIAAEIGVAPNTVKAARKATAQDCTVETTSTPTCEPAKRTGRDGKTRKMPARKSKPATSPTSSDPIQESCPDCETAEQHWQRSLSNLAGDAVSMPAFWTRQFGDWEKFGVTSDLLKLAEQAADVWTRLARDLRKRRKRNG